MSIHFPTIAPHSVLPVAQNGESWIEQQFQAKPNDDLRLLASHLTRPSGYLDMLLTGNIMTSEEVRRIFGKANTHRGGHFGVNNNISFSPGHVSWKYGGDLLLRSAQQYRGWGFITSAETVLQLGAVELSHDSNLGRIKGDTFFLTDLPIYYHRIRHAGEMDHQDGYGNFLELMLSHRDKMQSIRFSLQSGRVLIPQSDQSGLKCRLQQRREEYETIAEILARCASDTEDVNIGDRRFHYSQESLKFFSAILAQPFDFEALPVAYYDHSHLQSAMRQLSLIS